jgi:hypothetical protein
MEHLGMFQRDRARKFHSPKSGLYLRAVAKLDGRRPVPSALSSALFSLCSTPATVPPPLYPWLRGEECLSLNLTDILNTL